MTTPHPTAVHLSRHAALRCVEREVAHEAVRQSVLNPRMVYPGARRYRDKGERWVAVGRDTPYAVVFEMRDPHNAVVITVLFDGVDPQEASP